MLRHAYTAKAVDEELLIVSTAAARYCVREFYNLRASKANLYVTITPLFQHPFGSTSMKLVHIKPILNRILLAQHHVGVESSSWFCGCSRKLGASVH